MHVQPLQAIFFRDFANAHIPEIYDEIYLKHVYNPFLHGKQNLIIVDVGANIGLTSYYFKDYAREVFALEPDSNHFEELNQMIKFNKIKNITPIKAALSNKNGVTTLFHNPNSTAHNILVPGGDPGDTEEVKTITIDEFMAEYKLDHIDLLKLDPEGEEGKIISSKGFAERSKDIAVIVGEWHHWGNMEQQQFANTLTDLGYTFRWIPQTQAAVYTAVRI